VKVKGYTVQNLIIGTIISSIIATAAFVNYWPSVENAKVNLVKSKVLEQISFLKSEQNNSFLKITSILNSNGDGDDDILDELIQYNVLSSIPDEKILDKGQLTWIIQKNIVGDNYSFKLNISSTKKEDQELINKAVSNILSAVTAEYKN
jgi:Tfp pilus assembly protein PilE